MLVAGAAYAQEAPLAKVQACATLPRADERLACFEAAVAGLTQADTTGGVAEASEQAFGSTRPEAADIARAASSRFLPAPGMGRAISAVASLGGVIA